MGVKLRGFVFFDDFLDNETKLNSIQDKGDAYETDICKGHF